MMYKIRMMSGNELLITEERFKQIASLTGLVYIPELNGAINLSSVESILREDTALEAEKNNYKTIKRKQCNDGSWAIQKFGIWYCENNPEAKMDLNYYSELREPTEPKKNYPQFNRPEDIKKLTDNFSM